MALLVVLDLDAHADALEAGVVEVDRGFGGSLVTSVLLDEGPELDGDVVLVVADPDVGVLADEVVVDGTGEVGVDVGEGNVGGDADSVVLGALILVVEGLVACLDGGDGDVTNLVDVGLDLDAGGVFMVITIAVVAGDGNVAGLASELDASLGELRRGKQREEVLVQSVWVSSKRRKVGAFRGLVTLECERIRRSCTHLDVDVREVADVGDVAD